MNILLADDNLDYRQVLAALLQLNGHTVYKTGDGEGAFRLLHYLSVDVIISDIAMPRLSGDDLHTKVRTDLKFQSMPFIYVSGYPELLEEVKIENPSLDFCFGKLGSVQDMLDLIDSLGAHRVRGTVKSAHRDHSKRRAHEV